MGDVAFNLVRKLAQPSLDDKRIYQVVEYVAAKVKGSAPDVAADCLTEKYRALQAPLQLLSVPVQQMVAEIFSDAQSQMSLVANAQAVCATGRKSYLPSSTWREQQSRSSTKPLCPPVAGLSRRPTPPIDVVIGSRAELAGPALGGEAELGALTGSAWRRHRSHEFLREAQTVAHESLYRSTLRYMIDKIDVHLSVADNQMRLTRKVAELNLAAQLPDADKQAEIYSVFAQVHQWMYLCQGIKLHRARKEWHAAGSGSAGHRSVGPLPLPLLSEHGLRCATVGYPRPGQAAS